MPPPLILGTVTISDGGFWWLLHFPSISFPLLENFRLASLAVYFLISSSVRFVDSNGLLVAGFLASAEVLWPSDQDNVLSFYQSSSGLQV